MAFWSVTNRDAVAAGTAAGLIIPVAMLAGSLLVAEPADPVASPTKHARERLTAVSAQPSAALHLHVRPERDPAVEAFITELERELAKDESTDRPSGPSCCGS